MRGIIEIDCKDPEIIKRSIQPETENTSKFNVDIKAEKDKLILTIESETISGLLAGINSYIRLIRVSKNAIGE